MIYKRAMRPLLFTRDPEWAHEYTLEMLRHIPGTAARLGGPVITNKALATEVAGIKFPNPVGLAAGCDKNGVAVRIWPRFGYGFVEVGTITAEAQPGNPKPRVFRIPREEAIVNRLGFNNDGSETVARRLAVIRRGSPLPTPLAVNIGKTRRVSGDTAVLNDYRDNLRRFARLADFIVINVSSPNTPGLRDWLQTSRLYELLSSLRAEAEAIAALKGGQPVPLMVKVSPDMTEVDLLSAANTAIECGMAGIIATNTTISRDGSMAGYTETGGLSGRPLKERSLNVLRILYRHTRGSIPLVGVGGISSAEDAYERIRAGASLVQIYTEMIYNGPYAARSMNHGLTALMKRDGVGNIKDIVGVDC